MTEADIKLKEFIESPEYKALSGKEKISAYQKLSWELKREDRKASFAGRRPPTISEETCLKRSEAITKAWQNPEHRERVSKLISEGKRNRDIWDRFDEIKELWISLGRPGCTRFRRLAVSAGYPDVSYQTICNSFVG